jgi:hypothetical protein
MGGFVYPLPGKKSADPRATFRYVPLGRQNRPALPAEHAGVQAYVKGQPTRFAGEALIYQLLLELGWQDDDIEYHKPFAGGRTFVGGLEADFFINTWPVPTALFYDGDYWHQGELQWDDIYDEEKLRASFYGSINIIRIFEHETASMGALRSRLYRDVGPGIFSPNKVTIS